MDKPYTSNSTNFNMPPDNDSYLNFDMMKCKIKNITSSERYQNIVEQIIEETKSIFLVHTCDWLGTGT